MQIANDALIAAQEVMEQWLCDGLGLDINTRESESVVRRMLEAALGATEVQPIHVDELAESMPLLPGESETDHTHRIITRAVANHLRNARNATNRHVRVKEAPLRTALEMLRRDASEGYLVRGEVAEELAASIKAIEV